MQLYSYFRSSAVYRVRIALNLKGLKYDTVPVHLLKDGGEQFSPAYRHIHPASLVPSLTDEPTAGGRALTQSMAIIEYLDEVYPEPKLLPGKPEDRAYLRSLALSIACDIHPLNNLRVQRYLKRELKIDDAAKDAWCRHWCEIGLEAVESVLAGDSRTGSFCCGEAPTLADCFLVPQVVNALRVNCDLGETPTVMRIYEKCMTLDAFISAAPERQPDAE